MTDDGKNERKGSREDRLKLKLRENLVRRKSQARARDKMEPPPHGQKTSPPGRLGKTVE